MVAGGRRDESASTCYHVRTFSSPVSPAAEAKAVMPITEATLILMFLMALVGIVLFVHRADRERIARMIADRGGTVVSIERSFPTVRAPLSERNTTFWRVKYRTADGSVRMADCFASFLRCKVYRDEPDEARA